MDGQNPQIIRVLSTPFPRPIWVTEEHLEAAREHIMDELRAKLPCPPDPSATIEFAGVPVNKITKYTEYPALVVFTREIERYEQIRQDTRTTRMIVMRFADRGDAVDAELPPTTIVPRTTVFYDSRKNGNISAFLATGNWVGARSAPVVAPKKAAPKKKAAAAAAPRVEYDRFGRPLPPPPPPKLPLPQWAVARPWWETGASAE